ncbi:MAG: ADP-ribosylglycohydrolase family protein [Oceanipulchritudo sp.]
MPDQLQNALLGSLVADAVSMPVHWYYDREALDRDYGEINGYLNPQNPHVDSILWRSSYTPRSPEADILHEQAQYWGQRGIHYHQFLDAGENTLNFLLGLQLYRSVVRAGAYDPGEWLRTYIGLMQTAGWHKDTYVEEVHRAFFDQLAQGKKPEECWVRDLHIGGLVPVPFLLAALDCLEDDVDDLDPAIIRRHVALTHRHPETETAAEALARMLLEVAKGTPLREAVLAFSSPWAGRRAFEDWESREDREVVGKKLTPACYLPESFTAALHFVWKYHDDFSGGILANARCGGDNCHRGVVVGSLLGAANEVPESWLRDLASMERLRCDTLDPLFSG